MRRESGSYYFKSVGSISQDRKGYGVAPIFAHSTTLFSINANRLSLYAPRMKHEFDGIIDSLYTKSPDLKEISQCTLYKDDLELAIFNMNQSILFLRRFWEFLSEGSFPECRFTNVVDCEHLAQLWVFGSKSKL